MDIVTPSLPPPTKRSAPEPHGSDASAPPSDTGSGAAPEAATPNPGQLAKLAAVLDGILQQQLALCDGLAGVAFVGVADGRMGPITAQQPPVDSSNQSAASLLQGQPLERLERIAFAACSALAAKKVGAAAEPIVLSIGQGMYGEQAKLRGYAVALIADGRCEGACAIVRKESPGASGKSADALVLGVMGAVTAAFETFLWREQCFTQTQHKLMLRETVELLDAAQRASNATTMSSVICHELKRRFGCGRVSLGLVQRRSGFVRLAATSGVDDVDRNAPAVTALEGAFEECAAQDADVVYPPAPETAADPAHRRVTTAHAHLAASFGPSSIVSLPLRVDGGLVGVVLLERTATDPFSFGAVSLLRLAAETIGPAVWTRRIADRGVLAVARDRLGEVARAAVGPRHTAAKLIGTLLLAALLAAAFIPIPSRVTAAAEVRAAVSRTISPPFGGYLASVEIRPGDLVVAGQVLARMDTSELRLQILQARGELTSSQTQRDEALAKSELARVAQYDADVRKLDATARLLEDALSRAEMKSPIDGIVGRGELEQFIQARVDTSQPLFEIISAKNLTIAYVDERDVQRVRVGQIGRFVSKALPGERLDVVVERIIPLALPHQGANTYQVELGLSSNGTDRERLLNAMRPGMTGTVKLEDGWTTTLVRVLRPLVDEARLRLWW